MPHNLPRIDNYSSFVESPDFDKVSRGYASDEYSFFCPAEKEIRRAFVKQVATFQPAEIFDDAERRFSRVVRIACSNCAKISYLTVIVTDSGYKSFITQYSSEHSNNPEVPYEVSYYLEQAELCYNSGAYSAAVAMYRAALEQFLFSVGYKDGMLNKKIRDAKQAISDGKAPKWLREIDEEYLTIIQDLGNSSIHPNGGDIKAQEKLDVELVRLVQIVFQEILYKAFIEPERIRQRKELLKSAITPKPSKQAPESQT